MNHLIRIAMPAILVGLVITTVLAIYQLARKDDVFLKWCEARAGVAVRGLDGQPRCTVPR